MESAGDLILSKLSLEQRVCSWGLSPCIGMPPKEAPQPFGEQCFFWTVLEHPHPTSEMLYLPGYP